MKTKVILVIIINLTIVNSQPCGFYDKQTNTLHQDANYDFSFNSTSFPPLFNWQMVQTPIYYFISDIFFIDSLYGWASHSNGGILKTTDGGYNWVHTNFNVGGCICGISFINRDTGWICGGMGRIRKTTDGGARWINQDYLPYAAFYYTISFANFNIGYAAGLNNNKGYIIKTTNCGQNWFQVYLSDSSNTNLLGQFWFNENIGWVYGLNTLVVTTNGGINFIDYYTNIPPTSNGANGLLGLNFINDQTGWISAGNLDHKNMYKTTNSGINWVFQDNPITPYQFSQINDVIFINENTGWGAAYVGQIIATTNGGLNWFTDITSATWFSCFSKYNSRKVWCGADYGQVWILNDTSLLGIQQISNEIPKNYSLKQNYPNPFNGQTTIEFDLPIGQKITIKIFDILGREIENITNVPFQPGTYKINYNADRLSSGVYIYSLESENYKEAKKFILIK